MNWRYLLLFRWAVWQVFGAALLAFAWQRGMIGAYVLSDPSYISQLVGAVFLVGVAASGRAAWLVSTTLNLAKTNPFAGTAKGLIATKSAVATVAYYSGAVALIGLIGTIYGLSLMLEAMGAVFGGAADQAEAASKLSAGGMAALFPTLIGSIAALWLEHMAHIIDRARSKLVATVGGE